MEKKQDASINLEQIRQLTDLFNQNGLTTLEVCEGDVKIRLERTPLPVAAPVLPTGASAPAAAPDATASAASADTGRFTEVVSPMVGVFYAAPSPDEAPFVEIGARVKKGDVLCIIEAMKLFNEITADIDGEIAYVCAQNGDVVEFGQPLFKLIV